jgi:hypothetical protein
VKQYGRWRIRWIDHEGKRQTEVYGKYRDAELALQQRLGACGPHSPFPCALRHDERTLAEPRSRNGSRCAAGSRRNRQFGPRASERICRVLMFMPHRIGRHVIGSR